MLLTMAKVEILGPKKYFYQTLALLHQLGTIHLEDMSRQKENIFMRSMDVSNEATKTKEDLRNLITRLNGIKTSIEPEKIDPNYPTNDQYWKKDSEELTAEAEKLVAQLEEKARSTANNKSQMELELASLGRYQEVVKKIHPLAKRIVTLEGSETIAFLLEGNYQDTVNIINKEIGKITNEQHELISTPIDEETTAAIIVFNKKHSPRIHKFLSDKVSEIRLPPGLRDLSIDKVLDEIENRQMTMPKEINKLEKELSKMSDEWYYKLQNLTNAMENKIEEIKKIPTMGETDYTFVMNGWLPHKQLKNTQKEVRRNFGNRVLIRQLELSPHELEEAPVVIENPTWARPFELILKVWRPPRYGTIDPTKFVAIFFPIFFGYILGDIGYGLVVWLTATALKRKFAKQNEMVWASTTIFQIAGVLAIFFGILYGEAFGTLLEHFVFIPIKGEELYHEAPYLIKLGALKWPYHRDITIENRIMDFLKLTIILGFIHLSVSLVLGVVNSIKEKSQKHMIEKIGLLVVLITGVAYFFIIPGIPVLQGPSFLLLAIGILAVGYGAGPFAAMEHLFGLIGNLFSYLRLMAIGLAGAILAGVANELAINFAKGGSQSGLIIGIGLAIMLHIINIIVHTFSPTIHAIRLNVLEGFGKFYEAGGKTYKPFKARR